jgi:hypothetical protein
MDSLYDKLGILSEGWLMLILMPLPCEAGELSGILRPVVRVVKRFRNLED